MEHCFYTFLSSEHPFALLAGKIITPAILTSIFAFSHTLSKNMGAIAVCYVSLHMFMHLIVTSGDTSHTSFSLV